jgi:transposase
MGVIIGVDPHKASCTAAALDERGELLAQQRFAATRAGWRALRRWAKRWPQRRWAVEGAGGLGRTLAQQLAGDGEHVVDVPAKLAARVRLLSAGHGRKSDAHDAVSVAVAARGARRLGQVGDVRRFATKHRFAAHTGTAPIEASSGEVVRHRLSRAGNRKLNHALHLVAIVQVRHPTAGQAYYRRKLAEGKSRKEALRCLKRRLSDAVYRQLLADQDRILQVQP